MKNKIVIAFLIIALILPSMLFAVDDELIMFLPGFEEEQGAEPITNGSSEDYGHSYGDTRDLVMLLPDLGTGVSESPRSTVTDDYSYSNGYDRVSRSIKTVGYGKTVSSALTDAHDRLIKEVEDQLTYRMNQFTSTTLTDMVDYVRYYAVNRDKIISLIVNRAETRKIEQMKYGFIVTREVSRGDFEDVFRTFITSATEQMGVLNETSRVANEQLNKLIGVFEEKDPIVFSFIDGELQK